MVDVVDVRADVNKGLLKSYVKYSSYDNKYYIYLKDTETGETVRIGECSREMIEKG